MSNNWPQLVSDPIPRDELSDDFQRKEKLFLSLFFTTVGWTLAALCVSAYWSELRARWRAWREPLFVLKPIVFEFTRPGEESEAKSAEAGSWDPKTPPKDKLPAPPPTPRRPSTSEKSTQSVTSTDDETQQRRRACRRFMPRGVRIVKSAELATP